MNNLPTYPSHVLNARCTKALASRVCSQVLRYGFPTEFSPLWRGALSRLSDKTSPNTDDEEQLTMKFTAMFKRILIFPLLLTVLSVNATPLNFEAGFDNVAFYNTRFIGGDTPEEKVFLWPYEIENADDTKINALVNNLKTLLSEEAGKFGSTDWGNNIARRDINESFCSVNGSVTTCPVNKLIPLNMKVEFVRDSTTLQLKEAFPVDMPGRENIDRSIHSENNWRIRRLNLPAKLREDGLKISWCSRPTASADESGSTTTDFKVCEGSGDYLYYPIGTAPNELITPPTSPLVTEKPPVLNSMWSAHGQVDERVDSELRLHVFNVGSGNCAFLECPTNGGGDKVGIVLDCGATEKGIFRREIAPYPDRTPKYHFEDRFFALFDSKDKVDLVLSHADGDHYNIIAEFFKRDPGHPGSLVTAARAQKIRNTYMGGALEHYGEQDTFWTKIRDFYRARANEAPPPPGLLHAVSSQESRANSAPEVARLIPRPKRRRGVTAPALGPLQQTQPIKSGNVKDISINCGGSTDIVKLLAANASTVRDEDAKPKNSNAIVTSIEYSGKRMLMTADVGQVGLEQAKINAAALTPARNIQDLDVLSVPHHGSESDYHYVYDNVVRAFDKQGTPDPSFSFQEWVRPKKLLYQAGDKHHFPFGRSFYAYTGVHPPTTTIESIPYYVEHYFSRGKYDWTSGNPFLHNPALSNDEQKFRDTWYDFNEKVYISSDNGDMLISIKPGEELAMYCLGPFLRGGRHKTVNGVTTLGNFPTVGQAWRNSKWCLP